MRASDNNYKQYRRYFVQLKNISARKKTRTYGGVIFSLLAIGFFAVFAIKPTLVIIAQLVKETKDQEEINMVLEEKISDLGKAQVLYKSISKDLPLIAQSFPVKPEAPTLIKELEALARISSINFVSLKINQVLIDGSLEDKETKPSKRDAQNTIHFTLVAESDYNSLKTFLGSLDNLRRIVLVDAFSFKTGNSEQESLSLMLNAQAYFMP